MPDGEGGVIIHMGSTNALNGYHDHADDNASNAGVAEFVSGQHVVLDGAETPGGPARQP